MAVEFTIQKADQALHTSPQKAIEILEKIVQAEVDVSHEEALKEKETAILKLGTLYSKHNKADDLCTLVKLTRPFLQCISKAKAAKLVRDLVDLFLEIDAKSNAPAVQLCIECIEWAKQEKRSFLRQALEARLVALYVDTKEYPGALKLASRLLRELKKLDDKALLVEVQLLESKTYHSLKNIPKSRAALTSARTTANGIYCPPKLQSALDLQSGILHAEENDFKTAFSYFYEAFEGYDSIDNPKAVIALKYMLLSKIMLNNSDDVSSIVSGKLALRHAGQQVDAMQHIASASQHRSLSEFQETLKNFKVELTEDPIISRHLDDLYDNLLEQNLCRIIEPFSKVEVTHVAQVIKLPLDMVERKMSQMILDKKLHGILDQGDGVLIIFDDTPVDKVFDNSTNIVDNMGKVVDALYKKAKALS